MSRNLFNDRAVPLVLDGATGTQLQKRGMKAGECSERWLLEHPDCIDFQTLYAKAGAGAVYAPTFGANRVLLGRHGLGDRVAEYNRALTELSRQAVGESVSVGGDISSTGLVYGSAEPELFDELLEVYTEQAQALEAAGVDFFAVETQLALSEARAAVMAVHRVSEKPVLVSFTMSPAGRSFAGGSLPAALLSLSRLGIDAFGINCVDDPNLIASVLTELRAMTDLPLLVKPNAGMPEMVDGRAVYSLPAERMGAMAERFYALGADLFGGCCGSDETHIAAISAAVKGKEMKAHPAPEGKWACSEYELIALDGTERETALPITENLPEEAEGAELLRLHVENEEQLGLLLRSQSEVRCPLRVSFAADALRKGFELYYAGAADIV